MKLSIVTTLYRSAGTINEFYRRALIAAEPLGYEIEFILVNDGSPDDSLGRALALRNADPRVVVVDLSRNFGHHKALMTGIAHATGDLLFLLDSDLDEDPELLASFHARLLEGDCDVVYGFQPRRRGGVVTKFTGEIYFWLLSKLSDDQIPRNIMTARLMKRDYVDALLEHRDREFLISQLWASCGFRQVGIPAAKHVNSKSTYSFRMRAQYFVKHLTTSSSKLLYMIFYLGLGLSTAAAGLIIYYLLVYAFTRVPVTGFTSIIVSIWFFGALSTVILGIQGIYVANILSETKRRPNTVVRKVYGFDSSATANGLLLTNVAGALPNHVEVHEGG